jgi:methanol--5-hydroxybenzimidazolylcobamide Co-methyltransferase
MLVAEPRKFTTLAIDNVHDLIFGKAPLPLTTGFGVEIGGGLVYPEVNFTLPPMAMTDATWPQVQAHYHEIAKDILHRAAHLHAPGIVLEFELLPPMTDNPEWGAELTAILKGHMVEAHEKTGLKSALRVTPTDIREKLRPPQLRTGEPVEKLLRTFRLCAEAGADILSIESVGGKEVHDKALVQGDIPGMALGLGVLASIDMAWLWEQIRKICLEHGKVAAGGDSACGFANTAMQLTGQKMLPEVLAAVDRAMTAPRSLVAFEQGAVGPSKDCAYEGPILKAITGRPIAMEGKSAACAHFSPIGNIASAMCDLWSNESVQNVRLLAGNAPECFTEMLEFDCRLMNTSTAKGSAHTLRDLFVDSDEWISPQAAVLSPSATIEIASAIVKTEGSYRQTVEAGKVAVNLLKRGLEQGRMQLNRKEQQWLGRIEKGIDALPADAEALIAQTESAYGQYYAKSSYGLA